VEKPRVEKRVFLASTKRRDLVIGLLVGALVLAFVAWVTISATKGLTKQSLVGTIVAKHFTPQPEQQITIGKGGLRERNLAGECTFDVQVENKTYTVFVDQHDFDAYKEGDRFRFYLPRSQAR
jgi:hypothetical protein